MTGKNDQINLWEIGQDHSVEDLQAESVGTEQNQFEDQGLSLRRSNSSFLGR
jgi:hypothetical protein